MSFDKNTYLFLGNPVKINYSSMYLKDPKFLDRLVLANSADLDQTAPRSGSALFMIPFASYWTNYRIWFDLFI